MALAGRHADLPKMEIDLSRFRDTFFQESVELLEQLEAGLLRLEQHPTDQETLNAVFRAAHSIKGSAGMLEMRAIQNFTHSLESLLDVLRAGRLPVTGPRMDLLVRASDVVRALVDAERDGGALPPACGPVQAALMAAAAGQDQIVDPQPRPALSPMRPSADGLPAPAVRWRVNLRPDSGCIARGLDPLKLLVQLERLGKVVSSTLDTGGLPPLAGLAPDVCHLAWCVVVETAAPRAQIEELLDWFGFETRLVPEPAEPAAPMPSRALPERQLTGNEKPPANVRVSVEKIDQLVALAGELAVAHSIASEVAGNFRAERWSELEAALSEIGRQVWLLQQCVLGVRMLPARHLFRRLPRLVRELEGATGKLLAIEFEGEDAEMDKSVAELLADPLVHLVRNAADHGIEAPEERRRLGKLERGLIRVRAMHESGDVIVEVSDDGRGLDRERIRAKAIERGLLDPEAATTAAALEQLIFAPGFSTAARVTGLSGRGVGLDVVRRNVESMGGALTVASPERGGTAFRLRLPLTLAILDGLLVEAAGTLFLLPIGAVVKSVCPGPLIAVPGRYRVAIVDGEAVPLAPVAELLGLQAVQPAGGRPLAVLLRKDGITAAFSVDELVGRQQVIVRNLEDHYRRVPGLLGASVLGDGRVALILDPGWLIARVTGGCEDATGEVA